LTFPLETADRAIRETILSELSQRLLQAPWGMSSRVKHALRPLMLTGAHSMRDVAAHLEIHPRTLRRALKSEGTTFEALKDEIRHAVARQLLSMTQLPACPWATARPAPSSTRFIDGAACLRSNGGTRKSVAHFGSDMKQRAIAAHKW
jgi:AraC-like DNA-binding protein